MISEGDLELVRELDMRRLLAFQDASDSGEPGKFREYEAEVTTARDIDLLNRVLLSLPRDLQGFIRLRTDVWQEFRGGTRCSVCGNTAAQSKALNYNCSYEC